MEGHAALPDEEDLVRAPQIRAEIVKQHIAQPSAGESRRGAIQTMKSSICSLLGRGTLPHRLSSAGEAPRHQPAARKPAR